MGGRLRVVQAVLVCWVGVFMLSRGCFLVWRACVCGLRRVPSISNGVRFAVLWCDGCVALFDLFLVVVVLAYCWLVFLFLFLFLLFSPVL